MAHENPYRLAGVMGWPVAHSRSPLIHNYWIARYGLTGAYVLLAVEPARLEQSLRALAAMGFSGCNLTIPHKIAALQWVDHIEPLARRIGAINTIVVEKDGALSGRNTDAFGFVNSLRDAKPDWQGDAGPIVVLGAGGAARAVLAGLLDAGARDLRLLNRSAGRAQELAAEFDHGIVALPWQERHTALRGATMLVNTTNLGMHGQDELDIVLDELSTSALVSDVIYVPRRTALLERARLRGNQTVNGLGMLLHQARPAFEAWFGVMPELDAQLLAKVDASF
jgi:shikimate dehydrogenase